MIIGLTGSQKTLFLASLFATGRAHNWNAVPTLVVTHSPYQADRLYHDLAAVVPAEELLLFPSLETLPHEEVLPSAELARDRLAVYEAMVTRRVGMVVTSVQALCERLVPPSVYAAHRLTLEVGQSVSPADVLALLSRVGYAREEKVEGKGQFSLRGGILDVFPVTQERPLRIEFFDNEIESIRTFDPVSQRSLEAQQRAALPPAREFLVPAEGIEAGLGELWRRTRAQMQRLERGGRARVAEEMGRRIAEHVERFREQGYFPGAEQYKPFFFDGLATLVDYMPRGSIVVDEPARVREHLSAFHTEFAERHAVLLEKGRVLPEEASIFADWHDLYRELQRRPLLHFSSLSRRVQGMVIDTEIHIPSRPPEVFHGQMDRLIKAVARWRDERYRVLVLLSTPERGERLAEALREEELPVVVAERVDGQLRPGSVVIATGSLATGGEFPSYKTVILTDTEVFGRPKRRRRVRTDENGRRVVDFGDLRAGDFVVHINHGIGQYLGVETLEIGGMHKDYLVVKYAGEDKLYVPTDQIDVLQKYIGVEGQPPKLYKLGGNDWARVKKRVKESVRDMAQGLLRLYAEREAMPGHAFAPDTVWQQQFEETFPYEETPDQARAIEEVKADMERPRPMDRLLCGDVGYGKTEIAIRAAFKAVMDGRQVAVLVPTTILAQQHGRTFAERFEGYPITIRVLSRFESPAEQRAVLKGLENGTVDIVIGTHRVLSKDVRFKDLGLIVIDEEQRFGVAQKERLKELKKNVDALTLTATPIPRTLHMSLVGVRDMSVIETPPEDRFPIRTYVLEYDEELVREAILREMAREGQVYFVYNRVQAIDRMAARLMEVVPEARIAVAHGQMDEDDLEKVMIDFLAGEYDVLVCSTIIETGMDISNVNTLIVYDADQLGLAQ
ncbi:MAG TPA: transcription-repair coupling factor, partial [Limnochordia bacterium]